MRKINLQGHIASRVFNTPLLIEPNKASIISDYLLSRVNADKYDDEKVSQDIKESGADIIAHEENRIAIIPITGTLVHRGSFMEAQSGILSYDNIREMVKAAAEDTSVTHILLDIDSPGGEVEGNFDLAQFIRMVNDEIKPVSAIANGNAFSGAFSLGVAAGQFFMTSTGGVGSVGVIIQHIDVSQQNKKQGIVVNNITFGDRKDEFSPDFPLGAEAKQTLQDRVDDLGLLFVNHVAEMRNISSKSVIDTQAALIFGQTAVNIGFVDGIISFEDLLQNLASAANNLNVPQTQEGLNTMFKKNKQEPEATEDKEVKADIEAEDAKASEEASTKAPEEVSELKEVSSQEEDALDEAANAADIADLAHAAGMSNMTSTYIKAGLTLEQVKSKLDTTRQIKQICKLAGKDESAAAEYISAGASLEKVQEELFSEMEAKEKETEASNKQSPDQAENDFKTAGNVLMQDAERRVEEAELNKGK